MPRLVTRRPRRKSARSVFGDAFREEFWRLFRWYNLFGVGLTLLILICVGYALTRGPERFWAFFGVGLVVAFGAYVAVAWLLPALLALRTALDRLFPSR